MPLTDIATATTRLYDFCVAGAGPAGMSAALSLSEAGHAVLLLDAGSDMPAPPPDASRSNPGAHEALDMTHCQALGGTSWLWGGRIMPFGQEEFQHNNWPVPYDSYARYLDDAAAFLGGSALGRPFLHPVCSESFDLNATEMQAVDGPISAHHKARLDAATGPDILLSASVVGLAVNRDPHAGPSCTGVRLRLASDTNLHEIRARVTLIAMGGIETARLLLADRARHNDSLGHLEALGQRYSGHLTGTISTIQFPKSTRPGPFGWHPSLQGGFERQIFRSVQPDANMFFWAKNWPSEDAAHGSGILSAKYLLSRLRGASDNNQTHSGPGAPDAAETSPATAHLGNLIRDLATSLRAAPATYRAMTNRARRKLDHLIPNHRNCYKLNYHAEQEQRVENRIDLAGPVAPDRLPDIQITYDYSDADIEAVLRGHARLADELTRSGLAQLDYDVAAEERAEVVRRKARDGYHQIGTTRMGGDPSDSVVDGTCQVHGVRGVYLAGSGIFPSSGSAPPTQSIVALALRLADHLSSGLTSGDLR